MGWKFTMGSRKDPENRSYSWDNRGGSRGAMNTTEWDNPVTEGNHMGYITPQETRNNNYYIRRGEDNDHVRSMMSDIHRMCSRMEQRMSDMEQRETMRDTLGGVKDLTPAIPYALTEAMNVAKNPPETWKQYMENGDYKNIARMEVSELLNAMNSGGNVKKEISHTIAALMKLGSVM